MGIFGGQIEILNCFGLDYAGVNKKLIEIF